MEVHNRLDHNSLHLHKVCYIFLPLSLLIWPSLVVADLILHTNPLKIHILVLGLHLLWIKQHSKLNGKLNLALHKLAVDLQNKLKYVL